MKRVAIVGGGLAGLSCAYSLKVRGIDTTVFDAASKPHLLELAAEQDEFERMVGAIQAVLRFA